MAIKEVSFKGTIKRAYKKALKTPVKYSGVAREATTAQDIKDAGAWPNDDTIVEMWNAREKNNARSKSQKTALDAAKIFPPTLKDPSYQVQQTAKTLMQRDKNLSQADAELRAMAVLGITQEEIDNYVATDDDDVEVEETEDAVE